MVLRVISQDCSHGGASPQPGVGSGLEMSHRLRRPAAPLPPLRELIAPGHTSLFWACFSSGAHLCSGQGSQPPTLQGCSLPHLYKHKASCHHVAGAVQGCSLGASRFTFPDGSHGRPGTQLCSQGPQHSVIQLCLYNSCLVLHDFPQT